MSRCVVKDCSSFSKEKKPGMTFHRWVNAKFILELNAWKIYLCMLFDSDDIVDFNMECFLGMFSLIFINGVQKK